MATVQTGNVKGAGKKGNAAALGAVIAGKGKVTDAPEGEAKKRTVIALPEVSNKAMSKTVGPTIFIELLRSKQDAEKANELLGAANASKATALARLSESVLKAATLDSRIDLSPVVGEDSAAYNFLLAQLYVVLGMKEVIEVEGKNGPIKKLAYTAEMKDKVLQPGDDKDTPEGRAKESARTYFATQLKVATGAALTMLNNKMVAKMDKEAGTLRISGPAVKTMFGMDNVLLDERQNVEKLDKKGNVVEGEKIELKIRPSFSALKRKAEEAAGKTVSAGRTNDRTLKAMTPEAAIEAMAKSLVEILQKVKGAPSDGVKASIEKIVSACDKVLDQK